ncbi:hypothetical protein SSX86_030210 [Deinandra increscens subsp. villosa]|uniref:Helitron helicase-like domain-containing protein n=1 Tax=Deinandra increscens subsp. villosa TaxID=3103831 RepID=A0AAP0GKC0_9ASTR
MPTSTASAGESNMVIEDSVMEESLEDDVADPPSSDNAKPRTRSEVMFMSGLFFGLQIQNSHRSCLCFPLFWSKKVVRSASNCIVDILSIACMLHQSNKIAPVLCHVIQAILVFKGILGDVQTQRNVDQNMPWGPLTMERHESITSQGKTQTYCRLKIKDFTPPDQFVEVYDTVSSQPTDFVRGNDMVQRYRGPRMTQDGTALELAGVVFWPMTSSSPVHNGEIGKRTRSTVITNAPKKHSNGDNAWPGSPIHNVRRQISYPVSGLAEPASTQHKDVSLGNGMVQPYVGLRITPGHTAIEVADNARPESSKQAFKWATRRRVADMSGAGITSATVEGSEVVGSIHSKVTNNRRPRVPSLQMIDNRNQVWQGHHQIVPRDNDGKQENEKSVSYNEGVLLLHVHERQNEWSTLLRGGRLFQQYLVDAYTTIEEQRLRWTRNNQSDLRVELYNNICDAVTRGDIKAPAVGQRIVLPSSFTGSPRYMVRNYQDAMALCRTYGNPDLFITFTANPKWPEIESMLTMTGGQQPHERP